MRRYAAVGGILLVFCCLLTGPLVNRGFAVAPPGYNTLTWSDEFSGNSLDTSKWRVDTNPDKQGVDDPAAISVGGGNLTISTFTGADGLHHTGFLDTSTSFLQKYGYFEARIKYQQKYGTDSCFWMIAPHVGAGNGAAIDGSEVDISEHDNYSGNNRTNQAVIWYDSNYNNLGQFTGNLSINNGQFHTFGLSWGPSGYNFYVDNSLTYTVTQSNSISMVPEYLLLSTEVIGDWTGPIPTGGYGSLGSASNSKMIVDYVRVYAMPEPGDANLDGKVDVSDLAILAANYRHTVTGTPAQLWAQGDFNGDGVVDIKDLAILAANYRYGVASDVVPAYDGLDAAAIELLSLAGVTAVPEPGALAMLAAALIATSAYTWTRRR